MESIFEEKQNLMLNYTDSKIEKMLECIQTKVRAKYDRKLKEFTESTNKNFSVSTKIISF